MSEGTDKLERFDVDWNEECHEPDQEHGRWVRFEDAERLLRATARCGCPRGAEGEHLSDCVYDDLLGGDPLQAERRRALKAESDLATAGRELEITKQAWCDDSRKRIAEMTPVLSAATDKRQELEADLATLKAELDVMAERERLSEAEEEDLGRQLATLKAGVSGEIERLQDEYDRAYERFAESTAPGTSSHALGRADASLDALQYLARLLRQLDRPGPSTEAGEEAAVCEHEWEWKSIHPDRPYQQRRRCTVCGFEEFVQWRPFAGTPAQPISPDEEAKDPDCGGAGVWYHDPDPETGYVQAEQCRCDGCMPPLRRKVDPTVKGPLIARAEAVSEDSGDGGEAERIARAFHGVYETLAPEHGYESRPESRVPWNEVPEKNRALMIGTVRRLTETGVIPSTQPDTSRLQGLEERLLEALSFQGYGDADLIRIADVRAALVTLKEKES